MRSPLYEDSEMDDTGPVYDYDPEAVPNADDELPGDDSPGIRMLDSLEAFLDELKRRPDRIAELAAMPYREYLQTPEWERIRKLKVRAAQHRCSWCGRTNAALNVHHLTYAHRGFEELHDLVVVCRRCHALEHGKEA